MLDFIFDAHSDDNTELSHRFWFPQHWLMNLARAMGTTAGLATLFAQKLGLGEAAWVLASPVCWQATHNDAMVVGLAREAVLNGYFQVFVDFLAQDGARAYQISPDLWLFDASFLGESVFFDLDTVMHQSLQTYLMAMPVPWRRWWTEVQMLFQTTKAGAQEMHAIWPWGGGEWQATRAVYAFRHQYDNLSFIQRLEQKKWPKNAVILVDKAHHVEIYQRLGHHHLRLWWQDGYQIKPHWQWWQQLKRMVGYGT